MSISTKHTLEKAIELHRQNRFQEAEHYYREVLSVEPGNFQARHLFGVARFQQGRNHDALALIGDAIKINPADAACLSNYALVLQALGRLEEALSTIRKAVEAAPGNPDSWSNQGNILKALGRSGEAMISYDRALAIRPGHADALCNRATALHAQGRLAEALAAFEKLLPHFSRSPEILNNHGALLRDLGRVEEALAQFDRALALNPAFPSAHMNRGAAQYDLKRFEDALASFNVAARLQPDNAEARRNMGRVLQDLMRFQESLICLDAAVALRPHDAETHANRGFTLQFLGRPDEAIASFEASLAIAPNHPFVFGGLANSALQACDWARTAKIGKELAQQIRVEKALIAPFVLLGYTGEEALLRDGARCFVAARFPSQPPLWAGEPYGHKKIRLAYLSSDFHRHATAYLIAGLLESHDRTNFEIVGISYGPDDGSNIRARLIRAFDSFHDVRTLSDAEVAQLLRQQEVDIAVDLKGHTQNARTGILSHRPCPVQVNYLGFPGPMGAAFLDYVIGDGVVLPFDAQPYYDERIVQLPGSYLVNDTLRPIAQMPSRQEAGLPAEGFVFCCFNNSWKITAPAFDVWMRLLKAVPDSVLWLIDDSAVARAALKKEATARGVDSARLIFAPRVLLDDHLARHQLADLFLDTLLYNAHTTASDSLRAGVPIVTCRGTSFPGRVATSLLAAIGLPELITENLSAYEELALELAQNPDRLMAVRNKLAKNLGNTSLFDIGYFTRHLEAAYVTMWGRAERGEAPMTFRVPDQT